MYENTSSQELIHEVWMANTPPNTLLHVITERLEMALREIEDLQENIDAYEHGNF